MLGETDKTHSTRKSYKLSLVGTNCGMHIKKQGGENCTRNYRRGCKKLIRLKQRIEHQEMVIKTSETMQSSVVSTSYPALAGASRASGYPVAKFTGGSPNPL